MSGKKEPAKKARRARGTGSVFWDEARQLYVGRVPVGRTAKGRTRYVERSGPTQRGVVEALKKAGPPGPATTVREWADRWLSGLTVRDSTRESYAGSAAHIVAAVGGLKVSDVTTSRVAQFARSLLDGPDRLAASTVNMVLDHGRAMFEAARADGLVRDNPFALVRRPPAEKKAIDPFAPAELLRVIEGAGGLSAGPLIALLAATGMRLGEASALDVGDWDAAAGTVAITKTWSKRFGVGPPKSKHSRRTIAVPPQARPAVEAAAGKRTAGPLFRTAKGKRIIKSMAARAFGRLLKRLGLRPRNVHQLRHSVATALVSAGCPLGDAARYLGDSVATVVRTYLHPSGSDPAAVLGGLLGGKHGASMGGWSPSPPASQ